MRFLVFKWGNGEVTLFSFLTYKWPIPIFADILFVYIFLIKKAAIVIFRCQGCEISQNPIFQHTFI